VKFKPYPKYKASGVEWLGDVPEHWNVASLKHGFNIVGGSTPKSEQPEYWDGEIIWVSPSDLSKLSSMGIKNSQRKITPEGLASCGTTLVPAGSIVLSTRAPIGSLAIAEVELCTNQGCKSLVPKSGSEPLFYSHLLSVSTVELNIRGKGTTFLELSGDELGAFKVGVPPSAEQSTIAAILDRETTRIDNLIAKQEKLIELLKEKRQAVISHAVTKGLDPNVPMKSSGVEWLGDVPEHWNVSPVRYVARLESGHTPSRQHPEWWIDCFIPWFSLADVWQIRSGKLEYVTETKESISEVGLANSSARLLPRGTVILSRTASVGYSAIMGIDMATTQDFANWVCGPRIRPEYLLYIFRSMGSEFSRLNMGSTHQTIYMPDISAFRCPLPVVDEQDQIVKHIRKALSSIDTLIAKAQQAIALQKEHRTALISAAVTGKIDVRNEVQTRKAA
jgi:type I restriction enzyme, S subunit